MLRRCINLFSSFTSYLAVDVFIVRGSDQYGQILQATFKAMDCGYAIVCSGCYSFERNPLQNSTYLPRKNDRIWCIRLFIFVRSLVCGFTESTTSL